MMATRYQTWVFLGRFPTLYGFVNVRRSFQLFDSRMTASPMTDVAACAPVKLPFAFQLPVTLAVGLDLLVQACSGLQATLPPLIRHPWLPTR